MAIPSNAKKTSCSRPKAILRVTTKAGDRFGVRLGSRLGSRDKKAQSSSRKRLKVLREGGGSKFHYFLAHLVSVRILVLQEDIELEVLAQALHDDVASYFVFYCVFFVSVSCVMSVEVRSKPVRATPPMNPIPSAALIRPRRRAFPARYRRTPDERVGKKNRTKKVAARVSGQGSVEHEALGKSRGRNIPKGSVCLSVSQSRNASAMESLVRNKHQLPRLKKKSAE